MYLESHLERSGQNCLRPFNVLSDQIRTLLKIHRWADSDGLILFYNMLVCIVIMLLYSIHQLGASPFMYSNGLLGNGETIVG
jgi:hypothetical protein